MVTCEEIRLEENYLYIRFEGQYGQMKLIEQHAQVIRSACDEYACANILLDTSRIEGVETMSITEAHKMAKTFSVALPFPYKVIYLFPIPKTANQHSAGEHFETAAKNRGVRVNVYYDYDDAVSQFRILRFKK